MFHAFSKYIVEYCWLQTNIIHCLPFGVRLDLYMRTMLPSGLPAQQDNWSCGHRMVLLLAALLDDGLADEFNSGWASPITSFKIHPAVVSDEELHHLCGADVGAKEDPVTLASRSKQEKRFKTEPVAFPTKKPVVQSAEEHGSPCVQKRAASPKLKRKLEEDPVDPKAADFESALVAMAEQAIEERESKKEARAKAAFSKSVIKACGLTFNSFQVRHLKMFPRGLPKRHWNDFLFGIAGDSDVTCRVCMGLVEEFNVGAAKDQAMQERENNIRRAAPERSTPETMPQKSFSAPTQATKRARPGRPRRGEQILCGSF